MRMKLPIDGLTPMQGPFYEFIKKTIMLEGPIVLPVLMGTALKQVTLIVDFVMVNVPSVYNATLGRPSLKMSQAVFLT